MNEKDLVKIKELKNKFDEYFSGASEYGVGYLDCLADICETFGVCAERTENDLTIIGWL